MPAQETLTRLVIVEGFVQGVGYRHFAVHTALRLGLSGWVRNRADDTVEALISGPPDVIETMLAELKRGPRGARVRSVRPAEAMGAEWTAGTFTVRPTA
jgi:acylphosphatase